MNKLDFLIPDSIVKLINEDLCDLSITVVPIPLQESYPQIRISLDNQVIVDQLLVEEKTINYTTSICKPVQLKIEYLNKEDTDTAVDELGNIIGIKSIFIKSLFINSIDVIKTDIIYQLGSYNRLLSKNTLEYFKKHNIEFGPSSSLTMTENGSWDLNLKYPIVKFFGEIIAVRTNSSKWFDSNILEELYENIQKISKSESKN